MTDKIIKYKGSIIQHGVLNNRVYLMKLNPESADETINFIEELASSNKYTKIFTKIPSNLKQHFIEKGYVQEAFIPKFFQGKEDCCFMVKYPLKGCKREHAENIESINEIIQVSTSKNKPKEITLQDNFKILELTKTHADSISNVFKSVFKTYPFPVFCPEYIKSTMDSNILYFGIKHEDKLVSISSIEADFENNNAEMTDFATLPDYRGMGFATVLLTTMEAKLEELNIITAYTIARSQSAAMNITFSRSGYKFGRTLINNTNISGNIESMNIWYKNL